MSEQTLTPAEFIPLRQIATLTASKPNVLRKHRVDAWEAEGLARKDGKGCWWVNPSVIETVKPTKSRDAGKIDFSNVSPVHLSVTDRERPGVTQPPEPPRSRGTNGSAIAAKSDAGFAAAESILRTAISVLMKISPTPYPLVEKLLQCAADCAASADLAALEADKFEPH